MQTKNITNMKHEWADSCKARSHGSDQDLITYYCGQDVSFSICIDMFSIFNLQHNF